jgi:hypothetical protein
MNMGSSYSVTSLYTLFFFLRYIILIIVFTCGVCVTSESMLVHNKTLLLYNNVATRLTCLLSVPPTNVINMMNKIFKKNCLTKFCNYACTLIVFRKHRLSFDRTHAIIADVYNILIIQMFLFYCVWPFKHVIFYDFSLIYIKKICLKITHTKCGIKSSFVRVIYVHLTIHEC